jgi:hypothetical protein
MKHLVLAGAMVLGFVFVTSSAFANPALMKKHEGYPDETGKASTAVGAAANLKGAEDAPKALKKQNTDALGGMSDRDQLKHREDSRLPDVVGPGHVGTKGVSEHNIKEGTKVNANPK